MIIETDLAGHFIQWKPNPNTLSENNLFGSLIDVIKEATEDQEELEQLESLTGDSLITVYHATDKDTAESFLKDGIVAEEKPKNKEQAKYHAEAKYGPQKGLSTGLYVGIDPEAITEFGEVIVSVKVPKSSISAPPEKSTEGVISPMRALMANDAVVQGDIPPESVKMLELYPESSKFEQDQPTQNIRPADKTHGREHADPMQYAVPE